MQLLAKQKQIIARVLQQNSLKDDVYIVFLRAFLNPVENMALTRA